MEPSELLRQRLAAVGAGYATATGPADLARVLAAQGGEKLTAAAHPWLQAAAAHLPSDGPQLQLIPPAPPPDPTTVETFVAVGLGAIPETGTVLVGATEPWAWRLSLAPRRQLVVVPAAQARLSLREALALTAAAPGCVTWLTGPSRTADIEKVLVLGAQGPEVLVVIVYQDSPAPF